MVDLHICNPVLIASTKPWTVFNFLLVGDALAKESVEDSAASVVDANLTIVSASALDYPAYWHHTFLFVFGRSSKYKSL